MAGEERESAARAFRPAIRRAGLDGLTFHDLRHTYASLMVAAGVTPAAIDLDLYLRAASVGQTWGGRGFSDEPSAESPATEIGACRDRTGHLRLAKPVPSESGWTNSPDVTVPRGSSPRGTVSSVVVFVLPVSVHRLEVVLVAVLRDLLADAHRLLVRGPEVDAGPHPHVDDLVDRLGEMRVAP